MVQEDETILCSFVYGSVDISIRQQLWDELCNVAALCDMPWLICGDFNTIVSWTEKMGGRKRRGKAIRDFNEFITQVGVSDIGFKGSKFTWSNNKEVWSVNRKVKELSINVEQLEQHIQDRRGNVDIVEVVKAKEELSNFSDFNTRFWKGRLKASGFFKGTEIQVFSMPLSKPGASTIAWNFSLKMDRIRRRVLNDRVKGLLPSLISREQAGFVEGRNIHECIGLAHDLVKDINNKTFGGNVLIKLDMSKAYDRLSLRFLLNMLRALGFSEQWCDLIHRNIPNCWYSIAWDGDCYGHFKFNSQLLYQAVDNRKIYPYKPKVSGLMLNPDKSKVFFSEGIGGTRRKTILVITKFKEGKFPVIYLGAPLFSGRAKISYFKYLEDVVKGEIASWAKNFLLLSGRATLILSVLSSVSIHTLCILPVPKVVINGIERLMHNFVWDSGSSSRHHLVNWEFFCTPKDEGGLGLQRLSDVKQCLLSKLA
ncbi:hypothetical protein QQ045_002609 [Rhodiola kirilowii]